MTDREYVLAMVLTDRPHGPAVVLSGRHEPLDETEARVDFARAAGLTVYRTRGENTWLELRAALVTQAADFTIVTAAYHALRAFLTMIAILGETPLRVWNYAMPSSLDRLPEEFAKIARYRRRGHVASYAEGRRYLAWRGR